MGTAVASLMDRRVVANQQSVRGTITMSTSYATGGDSIAISSLGLTRLDDLRIDPGLGVVLKWDGTTTGTAKILAYRDATPAANAALVEPAAAQSLAATGVARFEALGV